MTPEEAPPVYIPQCLVLVTEIRTCICGASYRVPNPALMIESTSESSYRRRQYKPGKEDAAKLYRRRMEVFTKVENCEQCFVIDTGDYPRPRPQPRNLKRPHAEPKKAAPKPIALEDI